MQHLFGKKEMSLISDLGTSFAGFVRDFGGAVVFCALRLSKLGAARP